MVNRSLRSN
jgi:hypothetical protein